MNHTPVYTLAEFQAILRDEKQLYPYYELARKYGVNQFYLWHIINTPDYVPPTKVLIRLGIQPFKLAPVCIKCGQLHVAKRCPDRRKKEHDLFGLPIHVLRNMIVNRKEF